MTMMKNKGWVAQELFNEYLELKATIPMRLASVEYSTRQGDAANVDVLQKVVDAKVARMKIVLADLQLHGVKLEDLILLSVGVEPTEHESNIRRLLEGVASWTQE